MTKAEREHYAKVAALGCCVCRNLGYGVGLVEIHHTKIGITGVGRKSSHLDVLPLCPIHHQQGDGSERFAGELGYHIAPRTWEARYWTQRELLEQVRELLGVGLAGQPDGGRG